MHKQKRCSRVAAMEPSSQRCGELSRCGLEGCGSLCENVVGLQVMVGNASEQLVEAKMFYRAYPRMHEICKFMKKWIWLMCFACCF